MPKVLHINTFDRAGGAEEFALFMASTNNDILLVKKKSTENSNVEEFSVGFGDKLFAFFDKILWKLGEKRRLKQLLAWSDRFNNTYKKISVLKSYQQADIIHLHNIHGGYFDLKSLLKISREKQIVWTIHDRWVLTGGEAYLFDEVKYVTGEVSADSKGLYALYNPIIDRRKENIKVKAKILESINQKTHLIAPGEHVEGVLKKGCTIPKGVNLSMIYYGVDCNVFKNLRKRNWKVPRVLFLNSNSPFKNSKLIFSELKHLQCKIELHSFGSDLKSNFNGYENITHEHHGFVKNRSSVNELYNSIDIFVFSTFHENFPLISVEAAASGVFVLGSNIGPVIEQSNMFPMKIFDNKVEGDLALKLDAICGNLELTRINGSKASLQVQEKLNRADSVARYQELYEEILLK